MLLGAINPEYLEVKAIADIRPYNVWRAFHGDYSTEEMLTVRPGLMPSTAGRPRDEARRHVKVYGRYEDLIDQAKADGLEAVIIALPLHLHAPAAIAAMHAGLHVLTEKLMAHSVHECKDMARVAEQTGRILAVGHQRHYSILYDNAVETIRRGTDGRGRTTSAPNGIAATCPAHDSWQQPMPPGVKPDDPQAKELVEAARIEIARSWPSWPPPAARRSTLWRSGSSRSRPDQPTKRGQAPRISATRPSRSRTPRARWSTTGRPSRN